MKILQSLGCVTLATVLLTGCLDKGGFPGYEKSTTGLYSKFYVSKEGARKPKTGEYAAISVIYKLEQDGKDSVLFTSASIKESDHGVLMQPVFGSTFKGSFEEALMSMGEGDSASFKINADSVYLKTFGLKALPKYIPQNSLLTFYVKLVKVKTQQELVNEMAEKEAGQREEFMKQNDIKAAPTESGLYFIEKEAGKGDLIKNGQTAQVKYTGMFLNGKVFDSSDMHGGKPYDVTIGTAQVIPGWIEAIQKMRKGGKAMIIVPSQLAYGTQGSGPIPPSSSLVFDLEIVDVKK